MCLGMNPDKVPAGVPLCFYIKSNFVGRQGKNARTHLCSPAMAAAAAVYGRFVDVREIVGRKKFTEAFTYYQGENRSH